MIKTLQKDGWQGAEYPIGKGTFYVKFLEDRMVFVYKMGGEYYSRTLKIGKLMELLGFPARGD